jgi:hypothetical protein
MDHDVGGQLYGINYELSFLREDVYTEHNTI